jgi:hypothetical protein
MITTAFYLLIGYAICVLFPMPFLSRAVLDFWSDIPGWVAKVEAWFASFKTKPVANSTTVVVTTTVAKSN